MEKIKKLLLISLFLISNFVFSQNYFEKTFLNLGIIASSNKHLVLEDSSVIIVGEIRDLNSIYNYNTEYSDLLLMKLDKNLNSEWINFQGGYWFDEGTSLAINSNNIYAIGTLVVGDTMIQEDIVTSLKNVYLVKSDLNGNNIWTKNYNFSPFDNGQDILIHDDTIYTFSIAVNYVEYGWGGSDNIEEIRLSKIDSLGNLIDNINLYGDNTQYIFALKHSDGNFIILSNDNINSVIRKINRDGNILWIKNLPQAYYEIKETSNNEFYIVGSNARLAKLDSSCNLLWTKNYSFINNDAYYKFGLEFTNDSTILISGSRKINDYKFNSILIKTDLIGDTIWYKQYGDNYKSHLNTVSNFKSGILSSGWMFKDNNLSVYIIYSDTNGQIDSSFITTIIQNESVINKIEIYPNPTSSRLFIVNKNKIVKKATIFNLKGETISIINIENSEYIDLENINEKIIIVEFEFSDQSKIRKKVILKKN